MPEREDGKPAPPLPGSCNTCPFATLYRMPARAREVLRAQRLLVKLKGGVTFREVTGRSPSPWDVGALDTLATEEGRVFRSDQAIREREQKNKQR